MAERKKYIETEIPLISSSLRVLGTIENLKNKTIKLDLTRKMRGKGLTITFSITTHDGKLFAIPKRMELVKSFIRRVMRKRADYVEDSFTAKCEDIRVTVKPFLITRKKVSRAVRRNLRNTCREFLLQYLKERSYNDICHELLSGTLQREMLPKLKKVYPLSFSDIRVFETKELEKIDLKKAIEIKEENIEEEKPEEKIKEEATEKEVTKEENGVIEEEPTKEEELEKTKKKTTKKVIKKATKKKDD